MRKTAVIVIAVLLASCTVPGNIISGITSNPFSDSVDLTEPGVLVSGVVDGKMEAEPYGEKRTAEELTFPFVTDVHVDRTDSGVTDFTNEFISFLDGKDYPFTVCLGDLSDTGDYTRDHTASFISECQKRTNGNFVYVIGNHERHMHNESFWDAFAEVLVPSGFSPRMTRYEFGELSIYKLDDSTRIYGREQLAWLEKALENDDNPYKIFIAHINNTTGGVPDQSVVITGLADIVERNRIYRLMDQYGVSLLLTGHHHKGNIAYRIGESFSEFNAAALHRRHTPVVELESMGYWYTLSIVPEEGIIRVTPYYAETGEALAPYEFPLAIR